MKREERDYLAEARDYWKVAGGFPPDKETVYPEHGQAQEFERVRGHDRVLEYGCGGGSDTMSFIRRGAAVSYVDIVPENVATTMRRITEHHLADAAGRSGPTTGVVLRASDDLHAFRDNTFDIISSHGVIHHIPEPGPVLGQFRRLLRRPGGRLYIMLYTEVLFATFADEVKKLVAENHIEETTAFGWCTDGRGCPYARSYTEEEGRDLLESNGFRVDSVFPYHNGSFRTFRASVVGASVVL